MCDKESNDNDRVKVFIVFYFSLYSTKTSCVHHRHVSTTQIELIRVSFYPLCVLLNLSFYISDNHSTLRKKKVFFLFMSLNYCQNVLSINIHKLNFGEFWPLLLQLG